MSYTTPSISNWKAWLKKVQENQDWEERDIAIAVEDHANYTQWRSEQLRRLAKDFHYGAENLPYGLVHDGYD
jgi:hypothetical protein